MDQTNTQARIFTHMHDVPLLNGMRRCKNTKNPNQVNDGCISRGKKPVTTYSERKMK